MSDMMIDIETLGLKPDSVIISIACVQFDTEDLENYLDHIKINVDIESCENVGLKIYKDTWDWWHESGRVDLFETFKQNTVSLQNALHQLSTFIKSKNIKRIWCKGPQFDCIILENAYNACNMKEPWMYYQQRDVRTIEKLDTCYFDFVTNEFKKLAGNEKLEDLIIEKHDPLYDCLLQIITVNRFYEKYDF